MTYGIQAIDTEGAYKMDKAIFSQINIASKYLDLILNSPSRGTQYKWPYRIMVYYDGLSLRRLGFNSL